MSAVPSIVRIRRARLAALAAVALAAGAASARTAPLAGAGVEEHVGRQLPADVVLHDVDGRSHHLGELFDQAEHRPLVLTLAYFHCRMLCGRVLDGTARALRAAHLRPGRDVRVATVSIDPRDDAASARERRDAVMAALGDGAPPDAWPFLMGDAAEVARLAEALGFRYRYDPKTDQYAHPAVLFVVTPGGRVSSYLYGIEFAAADLRTAVDLAADGGAGASTPAILLRCFQYVPALRRYAGAISLFLRVGGALSIAALAAVAWWLVRGRRAEPAR